MDADKDIQDAFLTKLKGERASIFIVNGIKLQGVIEDFDRYVVILDGQMIYKNAISTVVPVKKPR